MKAFKLARSTSLFGFGMIIVTVFVCVIGIFMNYSIGTEKRDLVNKYGSVEAIPAEEKEDIDFDNDSDDFIQLPVVIGGCIEGMFAVVVEIVQLGLQNQQTRKTIRRAYWLVTALIGAALGFAITLASIISNKFIDYSPKTSLILPKILKLNASGNMEYVWEFLDFFVFSMALALFIGVFYFGFTKFGMKIGLPVLILLLIIFCVLCVNFAIDKNYTAIKILVGVYTLMHCAMFYFLSKTISLDRMGKGANAVKAIKA